MTPPSSRASGTADHEFYDRITDHRAELGDGTTFLEALVSLFPDTVSCPVAHEAVLDPPSHPPGTASEPTSDAA